MSPSVIRPPPSRTATLLIAVASIPRRAAGALPKPPEGRTWMQGFHAFGLCWKADEYGFYVDGRETRRTAAGGARRVPQYKVV